MNNWHYCQQVWGVLWELFGLLSKMEEKHIKNVEKMLSPKMLDMMLKSEHMRMAAVHHFHMALYLAESYGYLKALLESGTCPLPAQVHHLLHDHLMKMEESHHMMMQSMEEMKKKPKDKEMEEMMHEMMAEHHRVQEIIDFLEKSLVSAHT